MSRRLLLLALLALLIALPAVAAAPALAQSPVVDVPIPGYDPTQFPWNGQIPYDDPYTDPYGGGSQQQPPDAAPAPAPAPSPPAVPQTPLVTTPTVAGKVARMRTDGKAAIPRKAPKRIRMMIAAANQIVGKPYKWGGGHASVVDRGYDCSGAVSYTLIRAGLLQGPMVSGTLAKYGSAGTGRWATIYANRSHVYMEVAGLRLDTSPYGDPTGRSGVRWRPVVGGRSGFHVRHVAGL